MWKKLLPYVVFGMVLMGLMGAFISGITSVSGFSKVQEQVREEKDFFYSLGQQIPLTVALDRIAVTFKPVDPSVRDDLVQRLLSEFDLRIISELPSEIFILMLPQPLDRIYLFQFERNIQQVPWVDVVGMVVTPEGSKALMVLTNEFVAKFHPDVTREQIDQFNKKNDVVIVTPDPFVHNQFWLRVTETSEVDALTVANRHHESLLTEFAHPNFIVQVEERETVPSDPFFRNQWQHRQVTGSAVGTVDADVDTPDAWDITMGDPNVVIAVIDSGTDINHEDWRDPGPDGIFGSADDISNIFVNPGETAGDNLDNDANNFVDDVNGWDFSSCSITGATIGCGDNDPSGGSGHGTMTAGMAAARANNRDAAGNFVGVAGSCPNCRILPIRVAGPLQQQAWAFGYAQQMGAQIITNSWGYAIGTPQTQVVVNAINNAAAAGSIIFFAMNNANMNDCAGSFPDISSLPDVIAVSRTTNDDRFDLSGFGNCMDVLAPGVNVWSTDRMGSAGYASGNYTSNTGTSFATPLTAGVAGLILSVNPTLSRVQVQNLLQDTADKVEPGIVPGAAATPAHYDPNTGFSSPPSGHSTHGWGRINAFEAVRIAAPVENGGKGGVDVFIRDNRLDWGNTINRSNTLFEVPRGFIPHWKSVDIKVDCKKNGYQPPPTTSTAFDAFVDENPRSGEQNRVYVLVRNRGPVTATLVTVKLHWAFAGGGLPALPYDFWIRFPQDSTDPMSRWHPIGTKIIQSLPYSGSSVAGCPGRAQPPCPAVTDDAKIVQFEFLGPPVDPNRPAPNHVCLLAMIDCKQDPIAPNSRATFVVDTITPNDNNVTHRNVKLEDTSRSDRFGERFFVGNPTNESILVVLRLAPPASELLEKGWRIELDKFGFNRPFTLEEKQQILVTMKVTIPEFNQEGEVTIMQERVDTKTPQVMGGMTYQFRSGQARQSVL